eukprot:TRINITY_DN105632_c0_g1_i1.p1 TRINITY_DN105632_c0_g1~~TRINITY_DN105632_c0_g1_i1.p1  ORF type:complete len:3685 (-),score=854.42 TRINITY_DN105632_c0_g1_i1:104-9952(-)
MLDDNYFWRKLLASQGERIDIGSSILGLQKQLTDVEEEKATLQKHLANMGQQLRSLMEDNRRMKQQRRINIRDENELQSILHKEGIDLKLFDTQGFKSLGSLYSEIEQGSCWLQVNDHGRIERVIDMIYLMVKFKDLLLVESYEQDSSNRIQTRNYLPGVQMLLKETSTQNVLDSWFETGLGVDLRKHIETEEMPVYAPDEPQQQSLVTQAYPLPCLVQHSKGTFVISENSLMSQETLAKIGLPSGKHFATTTKDPRRGDSITRFWRWEKIQTFQANVRQSGSGAKQIQDVAVTCEKLFKDNQRADVYQRLLLQMFEVFEAQKLCGGFSGSVVIRVQPFEADGRPGEPCIVKLDAGDAIREEFTNSENVFKALPDRAARILGEAVYGRNEAGEEMGAMRLELAGACWNVPELAQGSSNLLSTFKDLLLYESEQMLLGSLTSSSDTRPFGNVNSVLAETFGPGGIVSSLRKGGNGLLRKEGKSLLWGWYTLKGKEGKYNLYTAKKGEYPPAEAMKRLYRDFFGGELPNLKEIIVGNIKPKLESLSKLQTGKHLCPLVGLAHGDLNAANIMIDALDAVWLIDFATSVELPLFTDMCKFEMACLFEYATIPLTPKQLMEFAGTQESLWEKLNVGDWLRIDNSTALLLLHRLAALPSDMLAGLSQPNLEKLVDEVVSKSGKAPHKQKALLRAIKARLVADQAMTDAAFAYAQNISNTLLTGDYIKESLEIRGTPQPEGRGARGAGSLRFFMEICVSVRRFMSNDVFGLLREQHKQGLVEPVDTLSLQLWLPFLRESYRIIGYGDIAPQYKVWVIHHCKLVANKVLSIIETIQQNLKNLSKLSMPIALQDELASRKSEGVPASPIKKVSDKTVNADFLDTMQWLHAHAEKFPSHGVEMNAIRKVHVADPVYKDRLGYYAPVFQVTISGESTPARLSFGNVGKEAKLWDLWLLDANKNGAAGTGPHVHLGVVEGTREMPSVRLFSRLLPLSQQYLARQADDFRLARNEAEDRKELYGLFTLTAWYGDGDEDVSAKVKGRASQSASREEAEGFISLQASAREPGSDRDVTQLELIIGVPCPCYPPGSHLCLDTNSEVPSWASRSNLVVVLRLNDTGSAYVVRGSKKLVSDGDGTTEFEPLPANHIACMPAKYEAGTEVLLQQETDEATVSWAHGCIAAAPSQANMFCHMVQLDEGEPGESKFGREVAVHLDSMNSGERAPSMYASAYEEEVHKIKAFFRARHSFIMDSLSGSRLSVKECAPPTLSTTKSGPVGSLGVQATSSNPVMTRRNSTKSVSSTPSASSQVTTDSMEGDSAVEVKTGWQVITDAVDKLNQGLPTCGASAFLIFGSPGSGKSCLVGRLQMEILDRYENLLPLLLPVSDLVKRSDGGGPDPQNTGAVVDWFDKYLRLTYGEDSLRYGMICQAMKMSRVVFLFEGLEDAEKYTEAIEGLIKVLVSYRNLVVVTSRPLLSGKSSLESLTNSISTMTIMNLSDEQKRMVAHARLGIEGIDAYDKLFMRLRASQGSGGQGEDGDAEDSDVFGNPMMLSMLLCYLQTMAKKNAEKQRSDVKDDEEQEGKEETTLTSVYRVAIDVMLQRVQSRQQADRHNMQDKVDQSKHILQKMSMAMQINRRTEILVTEVDALMPKDLMPGWEALKSAVSAGHAMFLRMTGEPGREELRFIVKGFQNFFAASGVATYGAEGLPDLKTLLTDGWWQQVLEMLGEAYSHDYVQLIQSRLRAFTQTSKDTFLHIAARAGHRPIFQLLHLLSEQHRESLNQRGEDDMTPLHLAAQLGHTRIIELMLKAGSDISAEDASKRMAVHVAMQNGFFQTAALLNERRQESGALMKPDSFSKAVQLAQGLQSGMTEKDFLKSAADIFTELGYFSTSNSGEMTDKNRTLGALLSVFWIVGDNYSQFVRGQKEENKLLKSSWDRLQVWTNSTVSLTKKTSTVTAMLVHVAIMNLGKIKPFKNAFAPDEDSPTEALAAILKKSPSLVPSFARLDQEGQKIVLSALKADFNFGQFLQAENLPASLFTVRQILAEGGAASGDILGFFLFRIFAAMSGILGMVSLEGSMFMNETNYKNFEIGLKTLEHLMEDGAVKVYDRFLVARAEGQALTYDLDGSREARALVRLACKMRAFTPEEGQKVQSAWHQLEDGCRQRLMTFLNADGIKTPGFLLFNSPTFMENAIKCGIPREAVCQVLLRVYEAAATQYAGSDQKVVTIMVDELANYAKTCQDVEVFSFIKFEIARTAGSKGDIMGNVHMSPWQLVTDKTKLGALDEEAETLFDNLVPSTGLKESGFLKKLPGIFPELGFFADMHDEDTKLLYRQTLGRLLVVYWTATNQKEAFVRGQDVGKKLSDESWKKIRDMTNKCIDQTVEVLSAISVVMAIQDVARLPKFQAQLAPEASKPKHVMLHVLENCPKVLPSYARLPKEAQRIARDCLTRDLTFAELVWAEIPAASLTSLKRMLVENNNQMSNATYIGVFLYTVFAEMSASLCRQSLEGSIYMTEDKWVEFEVGLNAVNRLEKESEQAVYDSILERTAVGLGLSFQEKTEEERAVARLACLGNATGDPEQGAKVIEALKWLEADQRRALCKYLAADGLQQKPAFHLVDARNFLQKSISNSEVGPLPAVLILLKVCEEVEKKFKTAPPVITVSLTRLVTFSEEFKGSVTFSDMPFELVITEKMGEASAVVIPKVWIPVRKEAVLQNLQQQSRLLASGVLRGTIGEKRFKTNLGRAFPEIAYFGPLHERQRDQTYGALLSVYWLLNDQHNAFIREQDEADALSKQSWAWIQEWMNEQVRLTTEEAVDAMMVFMAIQALGKIGPFREELAPGFSADLHDTALARILEKQPELVPSFLRLPAKYQTLILDSLSVDFQFSQFLQAEIVPSNLVVVKDKLQQHGEDGFAFFCFRIFAQMCGKLGDKSLQGSLFMTESQFVRFRPGLDALQQLRNLDAGQAYNAFLLLQGSKALSRFASPEHQALVRLLCLGAANDHARGEKVCIAFDELLPEERAKLTRWLTADGISQRPGYVLCDAPDLLKNAEVNPAVSLPLALKILVRVQELVQDADADFARSLAPDNVKSYVHLRELALLAREATSAQEFTTAELRVTTEILAESRIHIIEVLREDDATFSDRIQSPGSGCFRCFLLFARCLMLLIFSLLFVCSVAAAAALFFVPNKIAPLMEKAHFADKQVDEVAHLLEDRPHLVNHIIYVLFTICICSLCGLFSAGCCCGPSFGRRCQKWHEHFWNLSCRSANGKRYCMVLDEDGSKVPCGYEPLRQHDSAGPQRGP